MMFNSLVLISTSRSVCFFLLLSLFLFAMCEIKLATLNVNGARDFKKRLMLNELMKQKNLDIFMLQETHSDGENAADWEKEFEGLTVLSHNTSVSAGVAVLFSKSFNPLSMWLMKFLKEDYLKLELYLKVMF